MNFKILTFFLVLVSSAVAELTLWYNKSATKFEEAIPIGNGRLGGMVYGTVAKDRISLNECTIWNGAPGNNNKTNASSFLATAREKIFSGDAAGACSAVNSMIGGGEAAYQPAGNLYIEFTGHTSAGYRRELDLKTAIAETEYTSGGVKYTREYFASYPDQVLVVRLTADQPGKLSFTLTMDCPHGSKNITTSDNSLLVLNATVNAIKYQTRVSVKSDGGTVVASGSTVKVTDANSSTILLSTGTNFNSYNDVSGDQASRAEKYITNANKKTYEKILADHLKSYKELFDRVDINVGTPTSDSTLTTDAQVSKFSKSNDPQLVRLYYQFGRYLMISCSRGESQPANLQGVWNESTNPSWGSKYTTNINLEMNYWMIESANIQECFVPFVNKVKALVPQGKLTAKAHWGTDKGWVLHHNTDLWNRTAPIDGAWGMTASCGGWLATHLWEHYLFTLDKGYLADVYPTLKGAAEFFLATMVEESISGKKYLGLCPSASPENKPGAWNCDAYFGSTMENQIVRDVLNYTIEASKILNTDEDLRTQAEAAVKRITPNQVGKNGQLMEWFKDWDNPSDQHRHVSHCYGLFPSAQISVRGTPAIANAAKVSLTQRGDMATGWSLAWKINFWARLEDGNHAYKLIQMLLTPDRTYANLFDAHPPFQIDGNFGAVSGINEMLVQSQNNEINLLPALPDAWATGSFRGIRARGNFVLDTVVWSTKALSKVVISSLSGESCNLRTKNTTKTIETESGMTYVLDGSLNVVNKYKSGQVGSIRRTDQKDNHLAAMQTVTPSAYIASNSGVIRIHLTNETPDISLNIFDLSGKRICATAGTFSGFVTPRLNSGLYLVNITSKGWKQSRRVVVR